MNIQYSPDHIQSALNHLHNNFEDFKSEILNLSPDFAVDTEIINMRQHIGANDNDKVIASIKELASNLIKSIQIYLHRIGVTKEILMVGQVNANMKNSGKSGLKGGKVYIIPLEMVENYTVKKWFSIIENEISETLNLAYEFSNIRTDITENNLAYCAGQASISICSLVWALGIRLDFANPNEENIFDEEDFIALKKRDE